MVKFHQVRLCGYGYYPFDRGKSHGESSVSFKRSSISNPLPLSPPNTSFHVSLKNLKELKMMICEMLEETKISGLIEKRSVFEKFNRGKEAQNKLLFGLKRQKSIQHFTKPYMENPFNISKFRQELSFFWQKKHF